MAVEDLIQARENIERIIAEQTAAWVACGCPPTHTIDGMSWDWNNWLKSRNEEVEQLTALIRKRQSPAFIVRSRGRP